MKNYELIVERLRPSCGGQDPKEVKLLNVTTDDPVAYVRQQEKEGELEVSEGPAGEIIVHVEVAARNITYTFTED